DHEARIFNHFLCDPSKDLGDEVTRALNFAWCIRKASGRHHESRCRASARPVISMTLRTVRTGLRVSTGQTSVLNWTSNEIAELSMKRRPLQSKTRRSGF